ncbi:MAG: GNAT family N-acetyltransferase [Candidatus Kapabacteria bacterium]|nr:GNAT family N-acetyltransferase [Candidatus Kapabacteria bacterium]
MTNYTIVNTTKADLEMIYSFFEEAISYQKRKQYKVWNGYDKGALQRDIEAKLQYKVVDNDANILCVFSVCYADPVIWREKEQQNAIYLHRIVVNPQHKGQKQFEKIVDWAKATAKEKNLRFIRMDTWGDNPQIIAYYTSFGFNFVENYTTPSSEELPSQHRNLYLALLQLEIER